MGWKSITTHTVLIFGQNSWPQIVGQMSSYFFADTFRTVQAVKLGAAHQRTDFQSVRIAKRRRRRQLAVIASNLNGSQSWNVTNRAQLKKISSFFSNDAVKSAWYNTTLSFSQFRIFTLYFLEERYWPQNVQLLKLYPDARTLRIFLFFWCIFFIPLII